VATFMVTTFMVTTLSWTRRWRWWKTVDGDDGDFCRPFLTGFSLLRGPPEVVTFSGFCHVGVTVYVLRMKQACL
jgi:hypothetical protein